MPQSKIALEGLGQMTPVAIVYIYAALVLFVFASPAYHWTVHIHASLAAPDFPILPAFVARGTA